MITNIGKSMYYALLKNGKRVSVSVVRGALLFSKGYVYYVVRYDGKVIFGHTTVTN